LGLLDRIVATKTAELAALRQNEAVIRRAADVVKQNGTTGSGVMHNATSRHRPFADALVAGPCVSVIAEVKRRSPSGGSIQEMADPATVARAYEAGGASAVSVLTDREYFGGSLADLEAVRAAIALPVIRKDFIIDELQVVEAAASGASAILLIVRLLDASALRALRLCAEGYGMDALVEAHAEHELEAAIESGARIIGVNNRDLDMLTIDLAVSERLVPRIPPGVVRVAESGIRSAGDVQRMADAGADAVLVGESLMRRSHESNGAGEGAAELACIPRGAKPAVRS
jgi:indole-3-glycerol phosphate synthase